MNFKTIFLEVIVRELTRKQHIRDTPGAIIMSAYEWQLGPYRLAAALPSNGKDADTSAADVTLT